MSDKFCCVTWQELGPELIQHKSDEINAQIKELKLPRSIFASVIRVLNEMLNYCPVCGSCLNEDLIKKPNIEQHKKSLREAQEEIEEKPVYTSKKVPCRACAGKGILGIDKSGIKINCMRCHGQGIFEAKHIAEDPKAKLATNKVDDIREQLGVGENPIQGEAE